jgi:hypothetical protein
MIEQLPHFEHGQIRTLSVQSEIAAWPWTLFNGFYLYITKFMTCTSGCNYSLCTPDDGCGRHPKHVEWLSSQINKDYLELHLVGCLKHKFKIHGNMNIKNYINTLSVMITLKSTFSHRILVRRGPAKILPACESVKFDEHLQKFHIAICYMYLLLSCASMFLPRLNERMGEGIRCCCVKKKRALHCHNRSKRVWTT